MKILVVDDSREDRELLVTYIKQSKSIKRISIDESGCLMDALNKISINDYDVIILDLVLPETDGLQTIKTLKAAMKEGGKDIPVVVLTGFEDYGIGREAFSLGIKEFLIKDECETKTISRAIKFATSSAA
jgi:CheY-like chemotaxis protein